MEQRLALGGAFHENHDFGFGAWRSGCWLVRQRSGPVEVADAAAGKLARRGELLTYTCRVVAGPAQAPWSVGFCLLTIATHHFLVLRLNQAALVRNGKGNSAWSTGKRSARFNSTSSRSAQRISSRGASSNQFRK